MPDRNNDFGHLPLPLKYQGIPKYNGGGKPSAQTTRNKNNRQVHGTTLKNQSANLSRFWKQRQEERVQQNLPPIPGGIPVLLQVDPKADIDFLRSAFGFEIVSELDEGYIIIATNDIDMERFSLEVDKFINDEPRKGSAAKVYGLSNELDRLSKILSEDLYNIWGMLEGDRAYTVDIGVECSGTIKLPDYPTINENETEEHFNIRLSRWRRNRDEKYILWDDLKRQREIELEDLLGVYGGYIETCFEDDLGIVELPDSFTARVCVNGRGLRDIANNYSYIFEISLPDKVQIPEGVELPGGIDAPNINFIAPPQNAPSVCVIDSGIQEEHRYIRGAIDGTNSNCFLRGTNDISDHVVNGGHGTRVAGAVLYPNGIPNVGDYTLPCWIRNARILDDNNMLPDYLQPPKLLQKIVDVYHNNQEEPTKIFNHSIGSMVPCRLKHMSSWAAAIDNLSYSNDIIVIQAAGNISRSNNNVHNPGIIQMLGSGKQYPSYLLEDCCRISNPAQSLQALTVGSICADSYEHYDTKSLGDKDKPSGFSRTGPGIWDAIKPEVVEYGGDCAIINSTPIRISAPENVCPDLIRTSPPGPAYAKDAVGTSFAAPKVAYIAAELQKILPDEPALLYRALIVQSARWPQWAWNAPAGEYSNILRHMGYGLPSLSRATTNNEYRVTLITNGLIEIATREAHIYQVPIPQEMREIGEDFDILVEITLSYTAKPRRTRRSIRRYLSTWLDWDSSKLGEEPEVFRRRILEEGRAINDEGSISWVIGTKANNGQAEEFRRGTGTVQKDWAVLKSHQLRDAFCIAVRGHEGWDPAFKSKYSLAVSFEAIDQDIEIYESIRTQIEVEVNNQEVEIELGVE